MNRGYLRLFLALLASAMVLLPAGWSLAAPRQAGVQQQEPAQDYTEEEYNAYETATKEPDLSKREAALLAFMEKYPKSKLQVYIVNAYQTLLYEYQKNQQFDKLEPAAEKWLKYFPDDLPTVGYVADAAQKLEHHEKFLEYGQKIYAKKPSAQLASFIYNAYVKTGNGAKKDEWALKLLEYPEFNADFGLRLDLAVKYAQQNNLPKAAEYGQAALKSLAAAKKPAGTSDADWNKTVQAIKKNCNNFIGMNYYEQEKYPEAVEAFQKAVQAEQYDTGYYYIGLSLWKLEKVEDAILSFAKAELMKGDTEAQAKEHLVKLYKALHNNTTIGIEKVYKKAEAELNAGRTASM